MEEEIKKNKKEIKKTWKMIFFGKQKIILNSVLCLIVKEREQILI